MGQIKGKTGNPNGKPPGTINKITAEMRLRLAEIMSGQDKVFVEALQKLSKSSPKDYLEIYYKFISLIIPKPGEDILREGSPVSNLLDLVKSNMEQGKKAA